MLRSRSIRVALVGLFLAGLSMAAPAGAGSLPPGGTFVDDDGNTHEGYIEAIAAEGITKGCNPPVNDRYCPSRTVTRGQMAAFLNRARSLPGPSRDYFVDDDGHLFEDDINRLAEADITKGCNPPTNDRFCPDDLVTRGQLAAFLVRAYGYADDGGGDHFVDDDGSTFERDIDRLATAGVTKGCNPPTNNRFCPNDRVLRDQMASFLGRAEELTPMVPPPRLQPALETVVSGLTSPIYVTTPPGDDRLFILEKRGTIRIFEDGALRPGFFLDLRSRVIDAGEKGMLSLAFHPDYAGNGRFFVWYSGPLRSGGSGDHTTYLSEFEVSADPSVANPSETVVLAIDQPQANHNGGHLEFGADGYLYLSLGDGGGGGCPTPCTARNLNSLLGKILRLDVDGSDPYEIPPDNPYVGKAGLDEIWARGLRNPWRFAFDGGFIYIGDVGQNAREEVDAVSATQAAVDYGWDIMEGTVCFEPSSGCDKSGLTLPVLDYANSPPSTCGVIGGRVYRGSELTQVVGHYFYSDLCSGRIMSFRLVGGVATDKTDWTGRVGSLGSVWSFGSDADGDLYIVAGSSVYRLAGE